MDLRLKALSRSPLVTFRTQSNYFRLVKGIAKKIASFENQNQFLEEGNQVALTARLSTGDFCDAPLRTWPLRTAG